MHREIINPWKEDRTALNVLWICMALLGVAAGVMGSWLGSVLLLLDALLMAVVFGLDYPYVVLNRDGAVFRILIRSRFLPWSEFQQAGVCLFEKKKAIGNVYKSYKLSLLLPDGVPKKPGSRFSYRKNMGRVIYLPDTPQIREFVIAHYGLLDFDESVDPRGYSIVVD